MRRLIGFATLAILLTVSARAGAADVPAGPDGAIAPFVNADTLVVIRADVAAVDLKAAGAWMEKSLKASDLPADMKAVAIKALPSIEAKAVRWTDEFKQAGGKMIYVELNLAQIKDGPIVIVPLGDGADAAALENLFATGHAKKPLDEKRDGDKFAVTHGCMICSDPEVVAQVKQREASPRPDLAKALADAGDAPIRLVFVPSDQARAEILELIPTMPRDFGGMNTSDVLGTLENGYASLAIAPAPSLKFSVKYKDADNAATAAKAVTAFHDVIQTDFDANKAEPEVAVWGNVISLLAPIVVDNKVTLSVSGEKIDGMASTIFASIANEMTHSNRYQNENHLTSIGQAIASYTTTNKGSYPANLGLLVKTDGFDAEVLLDPAEGTALPGTWTAMSDDEKAKWVNEYSDYRYLGAGLTTEADPEIVVAYEKLGKNWAGGQSVLFANGQVEFQTPDQLTKSLEHSKELRDKAK